MCAPSENSLRNQAADIVRRLQTAGFAAFWVGGCVRDFLLGREPGDYDIATSALPEQIEKLFHRTIAVGRKFGLMVGVEGGHQFQVATFRAEADYRDGRHPEHVTFGDARADASRRDFTVNGLFYDPVQTQLHDWVGGEADLRAKIIRTIGAPTERFAEDHLRLLRAVRFAAQLDFEIERDTFTAVKSLAPKIKSISAERVREELIKLFLPLPGSVGVISLSSTTGAAGEASVENKLQMGQGEEARLLKTKTPPTPTLSPFAPRGEGEDPGAAAGASRRARAGVVARKRIARTNFARACGHGSLRAIAGLSPRGQRLQAPAFDVETNACRRRSVAAVGGAAARHCQAADRLARHEHGEHPFLRARENRRGDGGKNSGTAALSAKTN